MQMALELARKATAKVAPNPPVGAVLVRSGQVIGQGFHEYFGGPHAEINALNDCIQQGHETKGAELYVTLEPCCHQGKTGPCVEAILKAGISRVVVGCQDENPQIAGKGIAWLRRHGIHVELGCCENEAKRLAAGFFKWQRTNRPRVILKWAQSLDGKLAWPKHSQRRWISNEKSREHVHHLRQRCGAILIGIETVLTDNPQLSVRLPAATYQPVRVILDSRLRLPPESHLAQTARQQPVWIFTLSSSLEQNPEKGEQLKQKGCEIIAVGWQPQAKLGDGQYCPPSPNPSDLRLLSSGVSLPIDLADVLAHLGDRGITDLLVEGGAKTIDLFLTKELADEVNVFVAPDIVGDDPALPRITVPGWNDPATIESRLHDLRVRYFDRDVFIEGAVAKRSTG